MIITYQHSDLFIYLFILPLSMHSRKDTDTNKNGVGELPWHVMVSETNCRRLKVCAAHNLLYFPLLHHLVLENVKALPLSTS